MVLSGCGNDSGSGEDVSVRTMQKRSDKAEVGPLPSPEIETAPMSKESTKKDVKSVKPEPQREVTYEEAEAAYFGKRYEEAVELFKLYAERKSENPWGHYMLGLSAWKAGEFEIAEEAFERALAIDPLHVKSLLNLSRVLLDTGRPEEALAKITEALEIDSESNDAFRLQGRAYCQLGQLEEAVGAYRQAILVDDRDAWSMNNLGLIFIEEGLFGEALPPLACAVELRDDIAIFQNNLGMALERTGHFRAAEEAYRSAIAIDASYEKASANLSRVEAVTEDPGIEPVELAGLARRFTKEIEAWREAVVYDEKSGSIEPEAIIVTEADSTGNSDR